jgi:Ser/Thr protein kinase RdoA (MazF antagonist)
MAHDIEAIPKRRLENFLVRHKERYFMPGVLGWPLHQDHIKQRLATIVRYYYYRGNPYNMQSVMATMYESKETEDILSVLVNYRIGKLQSVSNARGGMTNDNWFIRTSTGRYFLRRRNSIYTSDSIDFELGLIEYLVAAGFPTAPLMRTRSGGLRVEAFSRHWELYKYIPGERFDVANPAQISSAAGLLAGFHMAASGYRGDEGIARGRGINFNKALHFIDIFEEELMAMKSAFGAPGKLLAPHLIGFFRRQSWLVLKGIMPLSSLPLEIVHGDFQPSNVLFHGDRAASLVDFGDAGLSHRAYDVAKAVLRFSTLLPDYYGQSDMNSFMDLERAGLFVSAYQSKLPLSDPEITAIPALLRGIYLYDVGFFLWKQNNPVQQAHWLISAWRFSKWIDKCANVIGGVLLS